MAFFDQVTRFLQFVGGSQLEFGVKAPYILNLADDLFKICDPGDRTKCVRIDAGAVATGTTAVINADAAGFGVRNAVAGSGNLALTKALSGSFVRVDGASQAYTLPAIGAADLGMEFTFFVEVVSTAVTITAAAGDLLVGGVYIMDFDTASTGAYFKPNGSSNLITTFDGTTKGGEIGTKITYTAVTATQWDVHGILFGDGVLATPFS